VPEPLSDVISTNDAFIQLDTLACGLTSFLRVNTPATGLNLRLEREEAARLRDALDRQLKATALSVNAAVERERANA
jgi:hypothetical protein